MDLSIIIPCYNEERNIKPLLFQLEEVLKSGLDYEIIFIDDGSRDSTPRVLKEIAEKHSSVKAILFQTNFGKAAALTAGFKKAKGNVVITMDSDLQDDPREIPCFLKKIKEGFDLVVGWKYHRKDPIVKTLPSKFFNYLTRKLTKTNVHDSNCGFKAYRREVLDNLTIYGELHRYIPSLVNWKGYKITEIKVKHRPRKYGKSKYGFERLFKGFFDLITIKYLTTFNSRPLHFFGFFGLLTGGLGVLLGGYLTYLHFIGTIIGDRPLLLLSVLLIILGIQFFSIGLVAELIITDKRKNDYVIRETIK